MTGRRPPVGGPGKDERVDLATAERIVAAAVAHATDTPDKVRSIVAARVEQAQRRASRDNVLLALASVVTLVALVVTGLLLWRSQMAASELAAQLGMDRRRPHGARNDPDSGHDRSRDIR